MDVNTHLASKTANKATVPQTKVRGHAENPSATPSSKQDIENGNDRDDTVSISNQGQRLSGATSTNRGQSEFVIASREQANTVAKQISTAIQDDPSRARKAIRLVDASSIEMLLN